ncbi:MAG: NADH-quinone oxidoreductase subunit H [Candidatus Aenigmatarchaeota archaeon]
MIFYTNIVTIIIELLLLIPLSILLYGLVRKINARVENRFGPKIYQPLMDILKLLQKNSSNSRGNRNIFFKIGPILYFVSTYSLFFILFGLFKINPDFIFLIYLLIANTSFYILLGFFSNSPFASIKSMKNLQFFLIYSVILTLSILSFFQYPGNNSLNQIKKFMLIKLPLASISIIILSIIEMVVILNIRGEEVELISGIETEYGGIELGFIEISRCMKILFNYLLITKLLINPGNFLWFFYFPIIFISMSFISIIGGKDRDEYFLKLLFMILLMSIIEFIRVRSSLIW